MLEKASLEYYQDKANFSARLYGYLLPSASGMLVYFYNNYCWSTYFAVILDAGTHEQLCSGTF